MTTKSSNIQWLDILRALAMLGVIVIHISSPMVNMTWNKNINFWWLGNSVDSAVRFAVPLFLMLSGATLLGKEYKLSEFYIRRFTRVLVPLLFWLIVYWVYRWATLLPKSQPHEIKPILKWATDLFLNEGVSKHFWYIYMILFIYLFVPYLGKWLRKLNLSIISNLLLFWVVLTFVFKSTPLNMYGWSGDYGSKLLGYFLYSGYLMLGYYLFKLPSNSIKVRYLAAVIFVITVAISAITTYFFSKNGKKLDLSMYNYLSVNTIIQSIAIFIWVKDLKIENRIISWVIKTTSEYSYGIYLVHIMVISIFFDRGIYWNFTYPLISLPALTLIVLVCSFMMIFVIRKIPFGKYISG
jgi:surface polysaccharide O-acyltransferase-like enzyme